MNPVTEETLLTNMCDKYKTFIDSAISSRYLKEEKKQFYLDLILEDIPSCKSIRNNMKKKNCSKSSATEVKLHKHICISPMPLNQIKKSKQRSKPLQKFDLVDQSQLWPNKADVNNNKETGTNFPLLGKEDLFKSSKDDSFNQLLLQSESDSCSLMENLTGSRNKRINLNVPTYSRRRRKRSSFDSYEMANGKVVCDSCHTKWLPRNTSKNRKKIKSPVKLCVEFDREWENLKNSILKCSKSKKCFKKKDNASSQVYSSSSCNSSPNDRKQRCNLNLGTHNQQPTSVIQNSETDLESVVSVISKSRKVPSFLSLNRRYIKLTRDLETIERTILKYYIPLQSPKIPKERRKRVTCTSSLQRFRRNKSRFKHGKLYTKKHPIKCYGNTEQNLSEEEGSSPSENSKYGELSPNDKLEIVNDHCSTDGEFQTPLDDDDKIIQHQFEAQEESDDKMNVNIIYQFFPKKSKTNDTVGADGTVENQLNSVPVAVLEFQEVSQNLMTKENAKGESKVPDRQRRIPSLTRLFSKLKHLQKK